MIDEPAHEAEIQPEPPRDREPFWGYNDLAIFIGLGLPGMLIVATGASMAISRLTRLKAAQLVPAQFIGYAVLFAVLYAVFRLHYDRPLWHSLGWRPMLLPAGQVILYGILVAFGVAIGSLLLRTPNVNTPMKELLSDPVSIALI